MAIRLDTTFEEASQILKTALSRKRIGVSAWGRTVANAGIIKDYNICNVGKGKGADDSANMSLVISYTMVEIDSTGFCSNCDKTCSIDLYSNIGDTEWTKSMKLKIFEDNYPSTIGVDKDTATLYFVFIQPWGIELKAFATLPDEDFEALEDINVRAPYRIKIDPDAMFMYIDGSEGTSHLRQNLMVEFDCGRPILVRASEEVKMHLRTPYGIV